jgi:hypothetical protein
MKIETIYSSPAVDDVTVFGRRHSVALSRSSQG